MYIVKENSNGDVGKILLFSIYFVQVIIVHLHYLLSPEGKEPSIFIDWIYVKIEIV